jgi:hypothetical protein
MISALVWARTLLALGIPNLVRLALYRVGLRTGLHPVCRLRAVAPAGPFFRWPVQAAPAGAEPRAELREHGSLFCHVRVELPLSDRTVSGRLMEAADELTG